MLIGFELGIAVRGQHFAVSVNLNSKAFCLLKQRKEVVKIMTRDEDRLAFAGVQPHLCGLRMSKGFSVRFVQNFHDAIVQLAHSECHREKVAGGRRGMGEKVENLVDLRVREWIARAKGQRMGSVRGDSLDAVEHKFLQVGGFFTFGEKTRRQQRLLALGQQAIQCCGGNPCGGGVKFGGNYAGLGAGLLIQCASGIPRCHGLMDQCNQALGIEINVGKRRENSADGEAVDLRIRCTLLPRPMCVHRYALNGLD